MSSYAESLLERLQYHTKLRDSKYSVEYLKKIHPKLDENNYLTYAYLATNPALSVEEREIYRKCMEELYLQDKIVENQIKELKDKKIETNGIEEIKNDDIC
jgi:hypothetical protein